jgi:nanoRNase/pAp phosphatase (c-di-AMP/oligoRNAs hydrolase)
MPGYKDIVNLIKTDEVVIRLHNFPDPDAIASAFGLQELLLRSENIHSKICYGGEY